MTPEGGGHDDTLEVLLRSSRALAAELDLDSLVQVLTDEATRLCHAQFGAFFYNRETPAGESYMLYAISGADRAAFAKFPMPRNTAIFAPTFAGERVVRRDDVTLDPDYGKNAPYNGMPPGHLPVRSYLAAPVVSRTLGVIGGLFFGHAQPGVFRARDEELIVALAAHAAVAIDNARLYQDLKESRDQEERRALVAEEIGAALTSSDTLEVKLQRCCRAVVDHLDVAAARIWEHYDNHNLLELRASAVSRDLEHGTQPPLDSIRVGSGPIGRIASTRKAQITKSEDEDGHLAEDPWAHAAQIRAYAGYPLVIEDRLVGVMAAFARSPFSLSTLEVLSGVSHQVAVAMDSERIEAARDHFRELFIGMLGHDLRNPLSAISTGAHALSMLDGLRPEAQRGVARIRRSSDRMARMITQLLDFARARGLSSTGIPVTRVAADLYAICRDVVEELRLANPTRAIDVELEGDSRGLWDVDRLAQVFSNLIGNGLDYADPAQPIRVSLKREGAVVVGEVETVGPTISETTLQAMFDPFRRVQLAKMSSTQGLGLGLYITHQIIVAHGGSITVASAPGSATRFRFELPAGNSDA